MPDDTLKEIVHRARVADYGSSRGYRTYLEDSFANILPGEFYWLFRNVIRTQVIPEWHEKIIALNAAFATGNGPEGWPQVARYHAHRIDIRSDKKQEFEEMLKLWMGRYLEERQYVTQPEVALTRTVIRMRKENKPQDIKK